MADYHIVQSGETLTGIAAMSGVPWRKVADMNVETIRANPDLIYPGDVLRLSPQGPSEPSPDRLLVEKVRGHHRS